jgi:hypothetical protein
MSTIDLYTLPDDTMIQDHATHLWVCDEDGTLIADYGLCTGLRLIKKSDGLTIYINDVDLVPGAWTLRVTTDADGETLTSIVEGLKEGPPASRIYSSDQPWDGCGSGERVSKVERDRRLSLCKSCPLLDPDSMTCTVSGKSVLDATTRVPEFCPEDLWGNKQDVLDAQIAQAIADGSFVPRIGPGFEPDEQAQFEAELDQYLESLT